MKFRFAIAAAALAAFAVARYNAHAGAESVESVDAITAASLTVSVGSVSATSAIINYSRDKYNYGSRTLCYDPAPATPTHNCITHTASGNSGSFTISNLKPGTAYNYSIQAVDTRNSNHRPYSSGGTFTTTAAAGLTVRIPGLDMSAGLSGARVDAAGRYLPKESKAQGAVSLPALR